MEKPLCRSCGKRPKALNYMKDGNPHYRSMCVSCIRKGKKARPSVLSWILANYKKKERCEKCGFKAKFDEQLFVYYIDGNKRNNAHSNLKTVCANCSIELDKKPNGWVPSDLTPDI